MPEPANLIAELADFGAGQRVSLGDPALEREFGDHVGAVVQRALADPIRLHGHRVESMFEALLVALGDHRLLKTEDAGRVFPAGRFKVPDFRVVLGDGEQWLVEVKNVYKSNPLAQRRLLMKRAYREALEAYAEATGARLKLAVYWARWSIWTLVSPEHFLDEAGAVRLDMKEAMIANELGRLGDRSIGTKAPLRLRFLADPARTSPIDDDGEVTITLAGSEVLCDADVISDPLEKEIAFMLMEHGEWECDGPFGVVDGDRVMAVEFVWQPIEPTGEGFEFIGTLSRMFARYFAKLTLKDGSVVQLRAPLRPGWFAPLLREDHVCQALPLWRFRLQPRRPAPGAA